jgi:hypothetical protein
MLALYEVVCRESMSVARETVLGRTLWLVIVVSFIFMGLFLAASPLCNAASYEVSISATATKFVGVGDLVTHVFTIRNDGTDPDTYALALTLPQGWVALPVPATISIPAGETRIIFVNSSVPGTAEAGTYEIVLKAVSSSVDAQATGFVQVRSSLDFELKWVRIPPRGQPGERLQGSFKVTNTGNTPDEYQVGVTASGGWEAGVTFEDFGLLPGESRLVEFYVLVPSTAATKTQYAITLTVTSIHDPSLTRTLSTTGQLGPPLPEFVGGSLFPEWMMSVAFDIDQEGDPRLSVRGWGDIEGFGQIDAGASLTIAGIEGARAWFDTGDWSIYLNGGTIVGPFLGVSGMPLFGGHIGELGLWRLLFTEESKGFYGVLRNDTSALRFSLGSDTARELGFQEIDVRHDFVGPTSGRFQIGRGSVQTASGIVWSLGGDVELEEWEFGGSFLNVGPNYPNQSPRAEKKVYVSYDGCPFPVDSSWSSVSREAGLSPNEYTLTANSFRVSAPVVSLDIFSCALSAQFGMQQSDDVPRSVDSYSYSLGCSLSGDTPVPWSMSTSAQWLHDNVTGTTSASQQFTVGGNFELGEIGTAASLSIQALQGATGSATSSGLSITLSDENLPGSPEVTFTVGGGSAAAKMKLTWAPGPDTEVDWTWDMSYCGEATFSTDISVRFPAAFPFCGPTKGRISGHVIVDENGNGVWDSGEKGVKDVLLLADDKEAITGSDGQFVFSPSYPGTYELEIKDLPVGLAPEAVFPMEVSVSAGDEPQILIPLRPQSWLRVRVFNDVNQNAARETTERGVGGIAASVKGEGFEKKMSTDANGRFSIEVSPGTYTITLDVESLPERAEATSPKTVFVTVPEYGTIDIEFGVYQRPRPVVITFGPPTASFESSPEAPVVSEDVLFTGASSQAVNADIVSYNWKFTHNDTSITRSGERVSVIFAYAGSWEIQLIVTDSNGLKGAAKKLITVDEAEH